jgi:hypothetical protein
MVMVVKTAQKYIGYLEHLDNDLLGLFTANTGKGGCTIFAYLVNRAYRWRNFSGLPWCATFVHSVFIEALGKEKARKLLGKPHPGTRVLYRRFKRNGKLTNTPKPGDIAFLTNGRRIDHCGIVVCIEEGRVVTIEGNTIDPSGVFQKHEGGAVAQRVRKLTDHAIVCYGGNE